MELSSRRASASQNPLVSSLWESLCRCSGSNLLKIYVLFSYKFFYYKGCHRLGLQLIDVPVFFNKGAKPTTQPRYLRLRLN